MSFVILNLFIITIVALNAVYFLCKTISDDTSAT